MITESFLKYSTDILAETKDGLTSAKIVEYCNAYAVDYDKEIPYYEVPFPDTVPNKRTALKENLKAFTPEQQFTIIKELSELPQLSGSPKVKDLRIKLISRYGTLAMNGSDEVNEALVEETKHWLEDYPSALKVYNEALEKWNNNIHQRNLLDDVRLAVELLLKGVLNNNKSLDNQQSDLGVYISKRKGPKELNNMFLKLVDYLGKYNNTYVKHNDNVNENEIEIIIEIASSFMKFLVKIN